MTLRNNFRIGALPLFLLFLLLSTACKEREPVVDPVIGEDIPALANPLTEEQVEHLLVLNKVWGFLKYHHPEIGEGRVDWDGALFRVLPEVLRADDENARNETLVRWVDALGEPKPCDPCAELPNNIHLAARLDWIDDASLLGPTLVERLKTVYTRRFTGEEHRYVKKAERSSNMIFVDEPDDPDQHPPAARFRLLTLFRIWNVIEYWFPYRNQIEHDWDEVFRTFAPRLLGSEDWDAYRRELFRLVSHYQDGHASIRPGEDARPPFGDCYWPWVTRFIEGRLTVFEVADTGTPLEVGDVIESIDGELVEDLWQAWSPYYPASNEPSRRHMVARAFARGACGESVLVVDRGGEKKSLSVERTSPERLGRSSHDLPGEAFRLLTPEVAYLKLSEPTEDKLEGFFERAEGTRGLIIDVRNYPADNVFVGLSARLYEERTSFVRFTKGALPNPGVFTWMEAAQLSADAPTYEGKVAILADESSLSHAEFSVMAYRARPGSVVVGAPTAGADGNISNIPLPGGLIARMSGLGVFYPDKTPTQRIGVLPDIEARPTIEGLREGRDEVVEAALRHILGPEADEGEIRKAASRRRGVE